MLYMLPIDLTLGTLAAAVNMRSWWSGSVMLSARRSFWSRTLGPWRDPNVNHDEIIYNRNLDTARNRCIDFKQVNTYPEQVHVDTLTLNKYTYRLVLHLLYMCTCVGVYMFACFGSNCILVRSLRVYCFVQMSLLVLVLSVYLFRVYNYVCMFWQNKHTQVKGNQPLTMKSISSNPFATSVFSYWGRPRESNQSPTLCIGGPSGGKQVKRSESIITSIPSKC